MLSKLESTLPPDARHVVFTAHTSNNQCGGAKECVQTSRNVSDQQDLLSSAENPRVPDTISRRHHSQNFPHETRERL